MVSEFNEIKNKDKFIQTLRKKTIIFPPDVLFYNSVKRCFLKEIESNIPTIHHSNKTADFSVPFNLLRLLHDILLTTYNLTQETLCLFHLVCDYKPHKQYNHIQRDHD